MKLAYCLNVYSNEAALRNNIEIINHHFNDPPIFVASNGIFPSVYPPNVRFRRWGENQGWQLGALNSSLQAIKFAAESLENPEEYNIIFCHDDVYPHNIQKINSLLEELSDYDLIVRRHVGRWTNGDRTRPYYMLEDIMLSGRVLNKFRSVPVVRWLDYSAEETFGNILFEMELKTKEILFETGSIACAENEMGFYHENYKS